MQELSWLAVARHAHSSRRVPPFKFFHPRPLLDKLWAHSLSGALGCADAVWKHVLYVGLCMIACSQVKSER